MTTTTAAADELQMLTIADLMALLRCSRNTAYARTREEEFPLPYVFGSTYRWPAHEVRAWMTAQRATSRDIVPADRAVKPATRAKRSPVVKDAPLPMPQPVAKRAKARQRSVRGEAA